MGDVKATAARVLRLTLGMWSPVVAKRPAADWLDRWEQRNFRKDPHGAYLAFRSIRYRDSVDDREATLRAMVAAAMGDPTWMELVGADAMARADERERTNT